MMTDKSYRNESIDITDVIDEFNNSIEFLEIKRDLLKYAAAQAAAVLEELEFQFNRKLKLEPELFKTYMESDLNESNLLVFTDGYYYLSVSVTAEDTSDGNYSLYAVPEALLYFNDVQDLSEKRCMNANDGSYTQIYPVKEDKQLCETHSHETEPEDDDPVSSEDLFAMVVIPLLKDRSFDSFYSCYKNNKELVTLQRELDGLAEFDVMVSDPTGDSQISLFKNNLSVVITLVPSNPKRAGLAVTYEDGEYVLYQNIGAIEDRIESIAEKIDDMSLENHEMIQPEESILSEDMLCIPVARSHDLDFVLNSLQFMLHHYHNEFVYCFPLSWNAYVYSYNLRSELLLTTKEGNRSLKPDELHNLEILKGNITDYFLKILY